MRLLMATGRGIAGAARPCKAGDMLCDALARVIAVLLRRLMAAPVHGPAREKARLGQFGLSTSRSVMPGQIA